MWHCAGVVQTSPWLHHLMQLAWQGQELSRTPGSCLLKPKTSLRRWTYLVNCVCVFAHMYVCAPYECTAHGLKDWLKSNLVVLFR